MTQRYFLDSPPAGPRVRLVGEEAHHLLHVMRGKPGDEVTLFDGGGDEFSATILRLGRNEVELEIRERCRVDRELPFAITLGVALPKGDRQKWLVEKAVELGVTALVPLRTKRGVVQPEASGLEKLRRGVIEASKQCGRNRLMRIDAPLAWGDWLASGAAADLRLVAHPSEKEPGGVGWVEPMGEPHQGQKPEARSQKPGGVRWVEPIGEPHQEKESGVRSQESEGNWPSPCWLAIGPEGGFTSEECQTAWAAGWTPVDLGPRILRIETAAIFLTALVVGSRSLRRET